MSFRVVLDANVLVPSRLRDVLLTLAEAGLFTPLWSEPILDEMLRHLPDSLNEVGRHFLVAEMTRAFPDAEVSWPASVQVAGLSVVNARDRHVVTTAIFGRAHAILIEDRTLRDECENLCDGMSVAEFLAYTIDVSPSEAREGLEVMLRGWVRGNEPPAEDSWSRLLDWMTRNGWGAAADILAHHPPRRGREGR